MRVSLVALALLAASAPPANASDVPEYGRVTTGRRGCASRHAGEAERLCGFLAWKKESGGAAKIGQKLFSDMKPNGENSWAGTAFNPEDGKRYTAKLTLSGDHLVTAGCVLGGLICQSFDWTRTRARLSEAARVG